VIEPGVRIIGDVILGAGVSIAAPAELMAKGSSITIGDGCDIASFVVISTADSHERCRQEGMVTIERLPIKIGARVFIGTHAVILGGCDIGEGSVIGAGVVLKNETIPPNSRVTVPKPVIEERYYWRRRRA